MRAAAFFAILALALGMLGSGCAVIATDDGCYQDKVTKVYDPSWGRGGSSPGDSPIGTLRLELARTGLIETEMFERQREAQRELDRSRVVRICPDEGQIWIGGYEGDYTEAR